MPKSRMILFVACAFIFCMYQAQGFDYERRHKNVGLLFSEPEKFAKKTNDIRKSTAQEATTPFLSSCDERWTYFNGHCYQVVYFTETWDGALTLCENRDSYLIEITTEVERAFVRLFVGHYRFWTGATDRENEGKFVYQHSKQQVPENYWTSGVPNNALGGQDCAAMYVSDYYNGELLFYDDKCRVYKSFVCEKP